MNFINQSTILFNAAQMMNTAAYAESQRANESENVVDEKPAKAKGEGFKGFVKKLNPLRLFSKIFKKHQKVSDVKVEEDLETEI